MDHETARERMQDDLDGRLSAAESADLASHLDVCPECAAEARGLASLRTALRAMPQPRPPADFRDGVMGALPSGRLLRFPAWLAGVAVAAVVVVSVVVFQGTAARKDRDLAATARTAEPGLMAERAETVPGESTVADAVALRDAELSMEDQAAGAAAGPPPPVVAVPKPQAKADEKKTVKADADTDDGAALEKAKEESVPVADERRDAPGREADAVAGLADAKRRNAAGEKKPADAPAAPPAAAATAAPPRPVRYVAFETEEAASRFVAKLRADAKDFVTFAPPAVGAESGWLDGGSQGGSGPGGGAGGGGGGGDAGGGAAKDAPSAYSSRQLGRTAQQGEYARADAAGVSSARVEKLRTLATACGGIVAEKAVAANAEIPPEITFRAGAPKRKEAAKAPEPSKPQDASRGERDRLAARGRPAPTADETIVVLVLAPPAAGAPAKEPSGK